jgi:hypothetical protein
LTDPRKLPKSQTILVNVHYCPWYF